MSDFVAKMNLGFDPNLNQNREENQSMILPGSETVLNGQPCRYGLKLIQTRS